jgi:hypothetical protein
MRDPQGLAAGHPKGRYRLYVSDLIGEGLWFEHPVRTSAMCADVGTHLRHLAVCGYLSLGLLVGLGLTAYFAFLVTTGLGSP